MVPRIAGCVLALALAACVADTTVIGDERSRAACAEAMLLEAPETGCSESITIDGSLARGCELELEDGTALESRAGTWVRLRRRADRAARVRVVELGAAEGAPPLELHLTVGGAAPCTCVAGRLEAFAVEDGFGTHPLVDEEQEILVPPRHLFEVSVCADEVDPFPVCALSAAGAGGPCRGTPHTIRGPFCACLPPCSAAEDCPVPVTGSASVECAPEGCVLRCSTTATCPDGQACVGGTTGTCMWPE